jgi:hypothetical protein
MGGTAITSGHLAAPFLFVLVRADHTVDFLHPQVQQQQQHAENANESANPYRICHFILAFPVNKTHFSLLNAIGKTVNMLSADSDFHVRKG